SLPYGVAVLSNGRLQRWLEHLAPPKLTGRAGGPSNLSPWTCGPSGRLDRDQGRFYRIVRMQRDQKTPDSGRFAHPRAPDAPDALASAAAQHDKTAGRVIGSSEPRGRGGAKSLGCSEASCHNLSERFTLARLETGAGHARAELRMRRVGIKKRTCCQVLSRLQGKCANG
ncbi:MAG: hypothetical protein JWQ55_978, partial [Rhodopila sp.]|nr:hypothetical protein [Rhodopila sp.]